MCSLFINDLDAGAGRMGAGTQYTVNNQMVNATLMNIADNPTNVQLPGVYKKEDIPRVPIVCTGNFTPYVTAILHSYYPSVSLSSTVVHHCVEQTCHCVHLVPSLSKLPWACFLQLLLQLLKYSYPARMCLTNLLAKLPQQLASFLFIPVYNLCWCQLSGAAVLLCAFDFVGNDFSTLYAPLIRDGRMEKFYWAPTREDRVGVCTGIFQHDNVTQEEIESLVDTFPGQSIDFFGALRARVYDDKVRDFVKNIGIESIGQRLVNSREGKVSSWSSSAQCLDGSVSSFYIMHCYTKQNFAHDAGLKSIDL